MAVDTINKKNDFFVQILKTSFATIALYIGLSAFSKTGALDYTLQKIDKNFSSDRRIEMMQEVEDEIGIDSEDNENIAILYAVMQNDQLEDWEKDLLYGFDELIKDNPYISLRSAYKALENINIEYTKRPSGYSESVLAIYSTENNTITIFQEKDKVNIDILRHELIHCLFNNKISTALPEYFIEGTSEILENEYFCEKPFVELNTYPYEVAMIGILSDMVGSDKILEAYTRGDMNTILLELSKTLGIKESIELLRNIENVFDSFEKNEQIDRVSFENMISTINKYLTFKFSESNDETIAEKFFYSKELLENMISDTPYDNYWKYIEDKGVYTEVHFSTRLKKLYPSVKRINIDGTDYKGEEKTYSYVLSK